MVDCDCDNATIRQIRVTNQTGCNGAGTSASFDDYFKADITFVFDRVPTAGSQINLRGDFRRNIAIPVGHNEITYTLKNVQLKADGKAIALSAYYNGNSSCEYATVNAGVAPSPCSDVIAAETISKADAQCADVYLAIAAVNRCFDRGTVFPQDDFYEADVMVNFTTIPSSGHLNIFIDGKDYSIPVSSISGNSYALDNIRISARQETIITSVGFSATPSCLTNQTLAPLSISGNSLCRKCNIINVTVLGLTCTADGIDLSLVVSGGVTADSYTLKSGGATYQGVYGSNTSFSLQAGEIIDIIDNDDSTCRYRFDIEDIVCQSAGRLLSDASATPWQYSLQLGIAEGGVEMANVIDNNLPAPLHFGKGEIYNSNHSQTLKLNFYPNPTTDLVLVTLPVEEMTTESATIMVYDVLGQLVVEQKVIPKNSQYSIKTIDFTSGVYQIVLQNGTKKWLGKLVKE